jgi:hypothetical protein
MTVGQALLGIPMIENFNTLIGMLVSGGPHKQNFAPIPVPVAIESDTDEAWQDFQASQACYDMEYATTLHSPL